MKEELVLARELVSGSKGSDGAPRAGMGSTCMATAWASTATSARVTEDAVRRFQNAHRIRQTGKVNPRTFHALIAPMIAALQKPVRKPKSLGVAVLTYARSHLAQHPREAGGPNRGPWVRLYTGGHEGAQWAWCAGFVSFVLKQAAELMGTPMPIAGSVGCDQLASQAKAKSLFLAEHGARDPRPGSLFLVRKSPTDWTHTGIVASRSTRSSSAPSRATPTTMACARATRSAQLTRSYTSKEFVIAVIQPPTPR